MADGVPPQTRSSPEVEASGGSALAAVPSADMYLPGSSITRIMKRVLPEDVKISKDVGDIVQECISEFISFITSEANDKCCREKRTIINGDDLLWAMTILGFEDYTKPLRVYLQRFRELEGTASTKSSAVTEGCSKDLVDPASITDT